ncbi:MAG TPA: hypothetical protein VNH15_01810 [Elusimicrobiota bacterium]|nr:hypothetical protein [Elusimicrobiota bacterium]
MAASAKTGAWSYDRAGSSGMSRELRWGADLLGAVCLLNAAAEGLSQGRWHSFTGIYSCYYLVLSAYASLREGEKWSAYRGSREKLLERLTGEFFVLGWIVLAAVLWAWDALIYPVCWPPDLYLTLKWVLAVFALSKGSAGLRAAGLIGPGWAPPDPGPAPSPAGGGGQGGGADDSGGGDKPAPAPGGGGSGSGSAVEARIAQVCRQAGKFTAKDIAQNLNLPMVRVGGTIGRLVEHGVVRKDDDGYFYWIGPASG